MNIKAAGKEDHLRDLRAQAEQRVLHNPQHNIPELSEDEITELIHELETHQIELEMQNDELQLAQNALLELHEKYTDLYNNAPIGYLTTNIKGQITQTNITLAKMLGSAREALINQPFSSYIDPEDQDVFYLCRKRSVQILEKQSCELRLIQPTNIPFWVRLDFVCALNADQKCIEHRMVLSDISDRKLRENEIKKLSLAVDTSSSGVILTNLDGVIEYVNHSFSHMSGYSREEILGEKSSILSSGETPDEVYQELWDNVSHGKEWKGDLHNRKKGGGCYWASNSISAVRDDNGQITNYMCVQDDVTQKYELTEKLSYQASHDLLTGLINRREFERRA